MIGTVLNNRYKIIRVLAEGGFGKTFLVEDTHMPSGRRCVLKLLHPMTNNPQFYPLVQQMFQREATILEDLGRHSQIPTLYAYFPEEGQFYLIQEFIEGKTLSQKIEEEGRFSESAVREILQILLPLLNFVHSKRIVHRDIKPDNIILRDADNKPVLIDFGAVRESMGTVMNSQGNPTSSVVVGTPGFMPAEQAAGRPVYASDIYSLGLTAIYLLTGKMPQDLETDPYSGEIRWHQDALQVSPSLAAVLDKAIQPAARDRFATPKDMLEALHSGTAPSPPPPAYPVPPTIPSPPAAAYSPPPPTIPTPAYAAASSQPPAYSPPPPTIPTPAYAGASPQAVSYSPAPTYPASGGGMVGGGGTFNTAVPVPQEIQGWNWGAFMLAPFWCFTNQVWVGLISWVPYVGIPMPFILGAKGNQWAWRSRQWRSVEDFKAHQRAWTKAGVITYSSLFALTVLGIILLAFVDPEETPVSDDPSSPTAQTQTTNPSPSPIANSSSRSTPATSSTGQFQNIVMGTLETYTHESGLFSISIPQGWTLEDNTKPGEVIHQWLDETENGLISIDVFEEQNTQTQAQLTSTLQTVLKSFFEPQPDFRQQEPVVQPDGSVGITWSFTVTADNGVKGTLLGNSFIEQRGNKISILTNAVPEEQYSRLERSLNQIASSYKIDPTVSLP